MTALLVAALTVVGVGIRLVVAHQSLFGDELSTYWISVQHGLGGVVSLLYGTASIHHAEITPPLSFIAAWLTTQLGHSAEFLRAPSLISGALSIPVIYLLGLRTTGRRAALVATAVTALSPFMIYYSSEARAYATMMLLVMLSTLAMLLAVDTGRTRWWVAYAVCSCAAVYTHYTCGFVLVCQAVWLWWTYPEARRPLIVANLGAGAALLPWIPGFINDFDSPTVKILSALSPFSAHDIPIDLGHWAIGYPYSNSVALSQLPGVVGLVLLGLAPIAAVAGIVASLRRQDGGGDGDRRPRGGRIREQLVRVDRRVWLIVAMAFVTPLGEGVISSFSTHIFGVRNLAASWPALALAFSALVVAPGGRVALFGGTAVIASFAFGGLRMLVEPNERPDYQAAADLIDRNKAISVVIDETGDLSPGPLTPLDVTLRRQLPVIRVGAPPERDHPFGLFDPILPLPEVAQAAVASGRGGSIAVVSTVTRPTDIAQLQRRLASRTIPFPPSYRRIAHHVYPGIAPVAVDVYSPGGRPLGSGGTD